MQNRSEEPVLYAVKHKDENTRLSSKSGGMFTAISDYVLNKHGVVYGCVLSPDDLQICHVRATNQSERNAMRGSKYVQSNMGKVFADIKRDLDNNLMVLFSGTSCQVAGLHAYLNREYENLICVDIICHGVSSPLVWNKYIDWQSRNNKSRVVQFDFTNKIDFGWSNSQETIYFENGTKLNGRYFTELFYTNATLRPCCYKCPYKSIHHPGDITIGDFWGIEKTVPEFADNKGISMVLLNNYKAVDIFDSISSQLDYVKTDFNEFNLQKTLIEPYDRPKIRKQLWKDLYNKDFPHVLKKYTQPGLASNLINQISLYFNRAKSAIEGK